MPRLFDAITVRNTEFRNRVFVAPMCQYSCENQDGVPGDWHIVHYTAMAQGGAALVVVEATGVTPVGRISPWCTGIWNEDQVAAWSTVIQQVHRYGAKIGIQLAHAGRKGSTYRPWSGSGSVPAADGGWQTISSTDAAFPGYAAPQALDLAGIDQVVADFVSGAKRAVAAGFDVIQIHAAHGYLIHQFLSPLANDRTDEYGGSLENRARLLLRIVEGVREVIGDKPLMVRFSASDWLEGGFTPEECADVAAWAQSQGADFFDISSGGITMPAPVKIGPGYQVDFARTVAAGVTAPVGAVGAITTGALAEEIMADGEIDYVSIGRSILGDPFWPLREAKALGIQVSYAPPQLERAVF